MQFLGHCIWTRNPYLHFALVLILLFLMLGRLADAYQEIDQSLVFRELVILCHEQLIFNNMSVILIFAPFLYFL